ncbi:ScyD/ScyE family protein [Telmatobacter sp. DSM 110680]|uniref:ScyD/ScyE family protein n=1 Tax=Telmatobacter sp. DSM 110680 TaxID=3036704 RepID=A0AAU7DK14_9BACT
MKNLSPLPQLLLTVVLALAPAAIAQLPISASSGTLLASGLNDPRGLTFGPDGSLYIAEAGTGGTTSTVGSCTQIPPPVGPDNGGPSARISKLTRNGKLSVLATGFPSFLAQQGDIIGVADVAFLNDKLYALVGGGGCSHGNTSQPNGIVKVNLNNGKWDYITNLSQFYMAHPAAYPNAGDFEPDGVPYCLIADGDKLLAVEPNHGTITATTVDGETKEIVDFSFLFGHVVPTSIVAHDGNLYIGNLGLFPIASQWERVTTLSRDHGLFETLPGLSTHPPDRGRFKVAGSRAGFTTIVSLKVGPDGLLYALELSDTPGGFPNPGDGKVVRINADGNIETVITGLSLPGGMTFGPDDALFVSNAGDLGPGMGEILRFDIPR